MALQMGNYGYITPTIEVITLLTAVVSGAHEFPTYPPAGKPGHWHIASVLAHELYHGGRGGELGSRESV